MVTAAPVERVAPVVGPVALVGLAETRSTSATAAMAVPGDLVTSMVVLAVTGAVVVMGASSAVMAVMVVRALREVSMAALGVPVGPAVTR